MLAYQHRRHNSLEARACLDGFGRIQRVLERRATPALAAALRRQRHAQRLLRQMSRRGYEEGRT